MARNYTAVSVGIYIVSGCITIAACWRYTAKHRYMFVLYGMSRAQWNRLPEVFLEGLITSLVGAGIEQSLIESYLQSAGEIELTKTHGRREVAFLKRAWDDVAALDYCIDREHQSQPLIENSINSMICNCAGYEGYGEPLARIHKSLENQAT